MKVVMIGSSGAGKTAFLAAMHLRLGRQGVGEFSIIPTGETLQDRLRVADELQEISFGNNQSYHFSAATTTKPKLWPFELLYKNKLVTKFEWLDYRGGLITERHKTQTQDQYDEVIGHIIYSDAIILVADSSVICNEELDIYDKQKACGIDFMEGMLKDFSVRNPEHPDLIVTIALTQCDAVSDKWKENDYRPLVEHSLEVFEFTEQLARDNPLWKIAVIPVSAVGEGTTKRVRTSDGITKDEIHGRPNPLNIEHVVFYSIGCVLQRKERFVKNEVEQNRVRLMDAMNNDVWWNRVLAWWNNDPDPRRVLEHRMRESRSDLEQLQKLREFIIPLHNTSLQKVRLIK